MKYEGNDRYQFQRWYVKAYRWLRYMPGGLYYAGNVFAMWFITGMPVASPFRTRREVASHIWMVGRCRMDMNMGHYFYSDEVCGELWNQ